MKTETIPAPLSLDDQLSNLERELTGLPDDHRDRPGLEKEFRRVRREIAAADKYARAVMSCFNHLVLGEIFPTLTNCEQFVAKHFDFLIGGKATEAGFDAMRKFGMSGEDIQNAIK